MQTRAITAQYYVSKTLKTNPSKAIKFIEKNREYFPHANDKWINDVK